MIYVCLHIRKHYTALKKIDEVYLVVRKILIYVYSYIRRIVINVYETIFEQLSECHH